FSATDLANHLACAHVTNLDLAVARGAPKPPVRYDLRLKALQRRGEEHELRYVEYLRSLGHAIHPVEETNDPQLAFERTVDAMRAGQEVIVQPTLTMGRWHGRADVLRRVDAGSNLGPWSYEAVDTKLSRETKAGTILQ